MQISVESIKELRGLTGAGIMDSKNALQASNGDIAKAEEILREKGMASAMKRSARATNEGLVESYIHSGGRIGAIVEANCETDFVARTDEFQQLVKELAMHVAAANPLYVQREDVPAETIEQEKEIFRSQLEDKGKPPHVVEKILEGKLEKYYSEIVLIDQPSIRDPKTTVGQLVASAIAKMGENVTIARFARFKIGEGQT